MVQLTEQGKRVQKELPCISEKVFEKTNMTKEEFFKQKPLWRKLFTPLDHKKHADQLFTAMKLIS
jgi:hypothetical protein